MSTLCNSPILSSFKLKLLLSLFLMIIGALLLVLSLLLAASVITMPFISAAMLATVIVILSSISMVIMALPLIIYATKYSFTTVNEVYAEDYPIITVVAKIILISLALISALAAALSGLSLVVVAFPATTAIAISGLAISLGVSPVILALNTLKISINLSIVALFATQLVPRNTTCVNFFSKKLTCFGRSQAETFDNDALDL